jgi:uncharacterized protein (TIGR00730 family)
MAKRTKSPPQELSTELSNRLNGMPVAQTLLDDDAPAMCHPGMREIRSVCVYCGSGPGRNPAYSEAARTLGGELAVHGLELIYGGGSLGLMGELARATLAAGGRVTGIIPEFLVKRERMLTDAQNIVITRNMHERKMTMFERSDAFVALPGGIGTLEELVEISTWAQLKQHAKPIVLGNIDGYWQPLLTLFHHMREEEFIRRGLDVHFGVADRAEEIVPLVLERAALQREQVPLRPTRQSM